jgi:hypothetical protein
MWHIGRKCHHVAAPVAPPSSNLPSPASSEQRGGARGCLSCCQTIAGGRSQCRGPHQRGTGPGSQGASLQSFRVVSALPSLWNRGAAGRVSTRKTARVNPEAAATTGRHSRQRPGGLRIGQRRVDLAHDYLGDGGGVCYHLSSRSRAQTAARARLLGAAAAPRAGAGQCGRAGPMAPAHVSPA